MQNVTSVEDVQLVFEESPSSRFDETLDHEQGMLKAPSSFLLNPASHIEFHETFKLVLRTEP